MIWLLIKQREPKLFKTIVKALTLDKDPLNPKSKYDQKSSMLFKEGLNALDLSFVSVPSLVFHILTHLIASPVVEQDGIVKQVRRLFHV